MGKVYCRDCRHFWEGDYANSCEAVTAASSDWYGESVIRANPKIQNKHNACQHWQHKRGPMEWLGEKAIKWLNNILS